MKYLKPVKPNRWSSTALALLLALTFIFPAYGTKTDMDDAKKTVTSLESQQKEMEATLKKLEGLKADTAAYMKELDGKLEALGQELSDLEIRINGKEADIVTAEGELAAAQQTEKEQYESMKLRIQYMYEKGDTSYIDMLMEAENISQLLNRAEYIGKISEYDRMMLDKYVETKNDIAGKKTKLEGERADLVALKEATELKQDTVEALVSEKAKELKNYENRINTTQNEISENEKDIAAQEQKIKAIEAEIKRKEEEAKKAAEAAGKKYNTVNIGNIKFIWPCPASSRITSGFGGRSSPTEGASANHQGVDIGASTGTNIVAAASGTVTIATYSYSAGNYVMINHGGGVSTVYMHCSQLLVSEGQQLTQGQVIAKVGSTGYSTGSHLHFGVRLNGTYVNPTKYVSP